jgi:uncharacterized repeat protein (TIGR03943 family)
MLFLWGGLVIAMTIGKQLPIYLHPTLQPYTMVAGWVLILLSLFSLRGLLKQGTTEGCCHHEHACCHDDHGHGHHDHEHHEHHDGEGVSGSLIFKTCILLLPLGIVLLGQTSHYTMSTIHNRGVVQDLSNLPAANAATKGLSSSNSATTNQPLSFDADATSGSMPIQVIDLLYAVQMPTYREDFEGKQVELIGQFVPLTVGNPKGNRFQAIRLFITCCAADAKPVGVTVQYDKPLSLTEMSWVKITGVPVFPMEGGHRTAILNATKVEECPAPSEPFVY